MFVGWMAYTRAWFDHDRHAITLGGGQMNIPSRYLTLLPAINRATATTGTPYFTENAGDAELAFTKLARLRRLNWKRLR